MYIASINVRFYETDMMGIAHHSNHFRWFEMARIEFLRHIGVTLGAMMKEDIVFPIMNVSCEYKEPARFDDIINIETYLVKMTRAQMVFRYRMRRASDGVLLATGETKNAFMSQSTGKIVRLDDIFYKPLVAAVEVMDYDR
ncbi:acyl-CoA thioesterase [Veillonella caviae]|uniref:acyl-CoA thioesterase n=1 Tax=Veillonella caviae TaxID=248316 RepID=UPI000F8C76F2|nr:thioesterase family protein [Veillonella caviae]MCF0157055.1 acyl-CoA thioesterase [Veillonella sp.]MCI5708941.1 acyl-CoA thioesterase [Veillonella caviae]MDY5481841.1 thioesterase family protein [Veillonella caviae]MDY5714982.1 thioesterase family protein [Veillonella caviae]MDY5787350.1 thioesterase family protein [Veillonella caviae]